MTGWTRRGWPSAVLLVALLLVGLLWCTWLAGELSSPLGLSGHHDFFALDSAGELVRMHMAGALYTPSSITALERQIFAHPTGYAGYMPFLNPPSAAALLAPLAALPESTARIVWLAISVVIAAGCVAAIAWHAPLRIWAVAAIAVLLTFPA